MKKALLSLALACSVTNVALCVQVQLPNEIIQSASMLPQPLQDAFLGCFTTGQGAVNMMIAQLQLLQNMVKSAGMSKENYEMLRIKA